MPPYLERLTTLPVWHILAGMNPYRNAKFALVIAEAPKTSTGHANKRKWEEMLLNIPKTLQQTSGIEFIDDNVWLIRLDTGLPTLCECLQWLKESSAPYRVLFLEESPDWLKYSPPATPTA